MIRPTGLLLLVVAGCASPRAPDVLFVTLDTTRADAMGLYGRDPSPTPRIDALGRVGRVVDEAVTVAPLTLPAHTTMFTGVDPDRHGLRDNHAARLDPARPTVAERLRAAGYATGAFVAAVVLDGSTGLDRGFDVYDDAIAGSSDRPGDPVARRDAPAVVVAAKAWLASLPPEKPAFVWVHLYDAHQPLAPAPGDPYLAAIGRMDAAVGELVDALGTRGPPLVVVVGDHGESRGDHGEAEHGFFVYRATTRVPWVVSGPGVAAGRVTAPRSVHDVGPTLLALTGAAPLTDVDGVPLDAPPSPVRGETWLPRLQYGLAPLRFVQDDRYRWIEAPRPELYDWRADPGEAHDLAAAEPAVAARLAAVLASRPTGEARVDAELREDLAALGYLPGVVAPSTTPLDPKDCADWPEELARVIVAARTRPPAEAVPILEDYRRRRSSVGAAAWLLSIAKELSGDPVGARDAMAPLLAAAPGDPGLQARDASLALAAGDAGGARRIAEAVVAARPDRPMGWQVLAELAWRAGDGAEAERLADRGLAVGETAGLRAIRAAARRERGDRDGALDDAARAATLEPRDLRIALIYAATLGAAGQVDAANTVLDAWAPRAPEDLDLAAALGAARYAAARYDEAEAPLRRAASDPERADAEVAVLLADVLQRRGASEEEVERWLVVAERRDPTDGRVARVRAAVRMAHGDVEGAMRVLGAPAP